MIDRMAIARRYIEEQLEKRDDILAARQSRLRGSPVGRVFVTMKFTKFPVYLTHPVDIIFNVNAHSHSPFIITKDRYFQARLTCDETLHASLRQFVRSLYDRTRFSSQPTFLLKDAS